MERERSEADQLDQRLARGLPASQDAVDAEKQLARLERLGQVVVGTAFEAFDAALGFRAGGQHEDGDVHRLPEALGQLHPVLARHHDVDNEEVEGKAGEAPACISRVGGTADAESLPAEITREQTADTAVIVDDEKVRRIIGDRLVRRSQDSTFRLRHIRHRAIRRATVSRSPGLTINLRNRSATARSAGVNPLSAAPIRRSCGPSSRSASARPATVG